MKYVSSVVIAVVSFASLVNSGCRSGELRSSQHATTGMAISDQGSVPAATLVVPKTAPRTTRGVRFQTLSAGKGAARPSEYDSVQLAYVGYTMDGRVFDATRKRGEPAQFEMTAVMPAWRDVLAGMTEGARARIWVPAGETGWLAKVAPAGPVVFDVDLVHIVRGKPPLSAPPDVAAPPSNALSSTTGLQSLTVKDGEGADRARPDDRVTLNFTGWTPDGHMFASSVVKGEPVTVEVEDMIPAWREAVLTMAPGSTVRLWTPEALATPGPVSQPKGPLVFELELLAIDHAPAAPRDVAHVPADAKRTSSGLAFRTLKSGSGTQHPSADARVTVQYSAWTPDGKLVDSSEKMGHPKTVHVSALTSGWKEGLSLMVEGDKVLFWMPAELAYKGIAGAPQGMVVVQVELVKISA